jgi:tetratricopeptide (TPR) repeat protein
MRKLLLSTATLCLVAQLATAQIRLPQPSPGASVMQTIGTTDVTIKYSRPSLKGREAFTSALVPYGKIWRTGANTATNFTTTTDLMVGGQKLAAGSYALLSIPDQSQWTLIFSKNQGTQEANYKQEEDALRVNVNPSATGQKVETFTIDFSDVTDSTANMNIAWGGVKATAKLGVDVNANAAASVDKAVAEKPEDPAVLQAAANYNLSKGRNLDQALSWADKSIGMKETFRNLWTKAQILAKMGKFADALPLAKKAMSVGESSGDAAFPFFKDAIAKGVTDYASKIPAVLPAAVKGKKK